MFQSWRQKLREVEDDLRVGRLDEALRALQEGGLLDFLPGKRLGDRLALMFAERAKRRAAESDLAGGWRDWASAVSLAELPASDVARRCLVDAGLLQVTRLADRRDFAGAAAQLDRWERHAASHAEVQAVRQTLRVLDAAMHLMAHGKFEEANEQLRRARELCPTWAVTGPLAEECREKQRQTRPLAEALFQSLSAENWPRVMQLADSLLAFAPQWKAARQARQRAWQQAGTRLDSTVAGQRDGDWQETEERGAAMTRGSADDRVRGGRFLLWVDGVGGYLVCLGDEVALGQQVPGNDVDVPILGDLSRRHARIRRSGEGYVIEAAQPLRVNGQVANPARSLADGDELELGSGIRFR
ncbi:MAG: FHA domain-containing protein, partial [Pirellulaceae bacterium]